MEGNNNDAGRLHSQEDYDAVLDVAEQDWAVWIGGSDREEEGKWTWTDGTPWDWNKWATADMPPENRTMPDNSTGANCLIQRTLLFPPGGLGYWRDIICAN